MDRVSDIAEQAKRFPEIDQFVGNSKVFVAGSTWPKGEEVICPLINNDLPEDWKVIIAPHEITESHLKDIEKRLELTTIRYSKLESKTQPGPRVLIIDNIGMLASLYKYGSLAYIGGGFGVGIHNILEPATFGLPVLFGPNHEKFREAVELRKRGGAFSVSDYADLKEVFHIMLEEKKYTAAKKASRSFIDENKGATDLIISYLAGKFITRLEVKQ